MLAVDRDGVLVGKLGDFESGHPKNYQTEQMPIIEKMQASLINIPFVVISNQQGIKWGYCSIELVIAQFKWLMQQFPSCKGCIFCPDEGFNAWVMIRQGDVFNNIDASANFRKPNPGMATLAKELGWNLTEYVGDLSGNPNYGDGRDSDRLFAENAGLKYWDVNDWIVKG